jgi:hypothetical protein
MDLEKSQVCGLAVFGPLFFFIKKDFKAVLPLKLKVKFKVPVYNSHETHIKKCFIDL